MKKDITYILIISALAIALGICLYFLTDVRNLQSPYGPEEEKVDTVYLPRYIPVESFKYDYQPSKYFFFTEEKEVKVDTIVYIHDTVRVFMKDSSRVDYSSQFLTQYTSASKLVQLLLDSENLSLTLFDTQGSLHTEQYNLNLEAFKYNYLNNQMSFQKNSFFKNIHPFAEVSFRPMNVMLDANIGIYHKTSKIIYELGLNGFYYPKLQKPFGKDFYFKLRYEF